MPGAAEYHDDRVAGVVEPFVRTDRAVQTRGAETTQATTKRLLMKRRIQRGLCVAAVAMVAAGPLAGGEDAGDGRREGQTPMRGWVKTGALSAPEAHQAAAASERFVFAIANRVVAKYDRATGKRIAQSRGEAEHLNSGFLWQGKLYCAHSNYPKMPEHSDIKVLDPESMELTTLKGFGASEGSLTWAVWHDDRWWCTFAFYGAQNARTYLVEFDEQWREQRRWRYPPEVVERLGRASVSGGIWRDGMILATGHDAQEIYCLRVPVEGSVLEYVDTVPAPFTGQGIADDPATGGLVGIDRKNRKIIFAGPAPPGRAARP